MKTEHIEPFIESACSVLAGLSDTPVTQQSLSLLGTPFSTASINIAARINGPLSGEVVYSMSGQTARSLASRVTGRECRDFGKTTGSGLAQLGAMLAEDVCRLLEARGYPCSVSSPMVLQGLNIEFSTAVPALSVPLDTDAGEVSVNVAVRDAQD